MKIDFASRKTTLVATPVDGRLGIFGLASIAQYHLGIDISRGEDFVVFVSKRRQICKVIFWDDRGACLISRRLHSGRFARYLMDAEGCAAAPITASQLAAYLDGEPIQVVRTRLLTEDLT